MKLAVIAAAVLVAGCSSAAAGQPAPDPLAMTADDIVGVMPEFWPLVETMLDKNITANRQELLSLTLYFRVMCEQKQTGSRAVWASAGDLQADLDTQAGKKVTEVQATYLVAAFERACPQFPPRPIGG